MKLLIVLILGALSLPGFSQLFKPVPKDLFSQDLTIDSDRSIRSTSSVWLPRLNVGLNAVSYGRNPETKILEVTPLSAIVFGLWYLHYKEVEGLPFNDVGVGLAYLQLTNKVGSGVGLYGSYNTGQIGLLNLGGHYDFQLKQFFFDTGISYHF